MSKSILVLDAPECCIECPMCFQSDEMSIGKFEYRKLYSCRRAPSDVEDYYLSDILHGKPGWCPLRDLPEKANHPDYCDNGRYDKGWNDCIDEILKGDAEE